MDKVKMSKPFPHHHILESLPDFVWITDLQHRYIAGSEKSAKILGFESREKMLGSHMSEIPCDIETEVLCEQRDYVIASKKTIEVLDVHPYASGNVQVHYARRAPYFDEQGKLVGVMTLAHEVNFKLFSKLVYMLVQSDEKYHQRKNLNRSYKINTDQIQSFTQRELECFYYLLYGYTAKKIASVLAISNRTVEIHLNNLKAKMELTNKSDLIEKGLAMGILKNIPVSLIKNLSVIL